jgi:hypothetical protein
LVALESTDDELNLHIDEFNLPFQHKPIQRNDFIPNSKTELRKTAATTFCKIADVVSASILIAAPGDSVHVAILARANRTANTTFILYYISGWQIWTLLFSNCF